ncbi:hypothetical protein HY635_00125 [Candidatus Uhrbacteria bacterium]|nr:hypothetical protein [Candidatus Uhrbacteria bacterium]
MAPSQSLRYEWSPRYRFRMQHYSMAMYLVITPMLLGCAVPFLAFGGFTESAKTSAFVLSIVVGFLLSLLLAMGQGRALGRERMRFAAFLREADARGGWWFWRDYDGSVHIVGRGATNHGDWPPQLIEPLDPAQEAHRMAMRDEIARLRGIALECDQTSRASHEASGELESFLAHAQQPA